MKNTTSIVVTILAWAAPALGHGYVYRVTADNTVYPGWDVALDPWLSPPPSRIAFGGGIVGPIINISSPNMACNMARLPPAAPAVVRAGSNITFHWSHWLRSHKGPITAWLAPHSSPLSSLDVTDLSFFKIAQDTVDAAGIWANIRMMDSNQKTFTATIPADIKPGKYIVRHEIVALHFSEGNKIPPGWESTAVGAQFYPHCFSVEVVGGRGTAVPEGVKFPGAYRVEDEGMRFDVRGGGGGKRYTPLGPEVYKGQDAGGGIVDLEERETVVVSPTGNGAEADAAYFEAQRVFLEQQGAIVSYFDSIGG